jgi:hypothetical protein
MRPMLYGLTLIVVFHLGVGKHALLAGISSRASFRPLVSCSNQIWGANLFWFIPEAADLILIGPVWSRDFFVLRRKRASSDASYPHTIVLTSGATRRVDCVRQSSLFHCTRGSPPSYDTRGIPPRYNATTCDHVRRHSLCYQGSPPSYDTRGIPPRYNATTCDHVRRHSLFMIVYLHTPNYD